ncbi:DNA polymerase III beta subunit [Geomicrobium sp. JCM 19037]|uniref:DNA polymerase III subunit beta n=1 Tax=unclassified Geomicrobium TaxID=2628951 RepID=UPI00045F1930|nr:MULTISPECIES: DNA polymerase III subunit beta [unclassified Geomicrobium]GAK04814.1 DNA polymerase III beta subunit [Geomicrobium sp. JCM 19037]GAK11984.1 DNA polymerase III beta subunit [Geomicrobium sp. JCM 19039]
MHLTIDTNTFVTAVQYVSKAVSSRTTIQILTGIKIVATQEGVTLTGSDSDISIETFIPLGDEEREYMTVHEEGQLVLQEKYFTDIVKKMPGESLTLQKDGQMAATIQSNAVVFNLNGYDPDDYPRLPELPEDNRLTLPQHLLKDMIRQTVFAVSSQETRPVLTGVNFDVENQQLTATATDSHRLAMRSATVDTSDELDFTNVIIPGKSLVELSRILKDDETPVTVVLEKTQVLFKMENLLFYSRLLDGKFPLTNNMIPQSGKMTLTLSTKPLNQALDRAMLLSREAKNNVIHMRISSDGDVEITSVSAEVGKVKEQLTAEMMDGEELRIAFNGKNISDALKVIDSESISIMFTGSMSPFVIRPTDHNQMTHLFSPVRTN